MFLIPLHNLCLVRLDSRPETSCQLIVIGFNLFLGGGVEDALLEPLQEKLVMVVSDVLSLGDAAKDAQSAASRQKSPAMDYSRLPSSPRHQDGHGMNGQGW